MRTKIFKLISSILLLMAGAGFCFGQKLTLTGKVYDIQHEAISYVNISINSKTYIGTASDLQGRFIIPLQYVNDNDTLVFSCIGYNNYYLPVVAAKSTDELVVILDENIIAFDEISVSARRSTVNEIIKNFNKGRKIFIPENITRFEIFARQIIKLGNVYYSLLESYLTLSAENQNVLSGDILYFDKISKNDNYECHKNEFYPSIDFIVFSDYPIIRKIKKYKYSIDTVMPFDGDGLVYVISERYHGNNSSATYVETIANGDVIIKEFIQDSTSGNKTEHTVINTYFITEEYKIHKVIYKTYFKNARNNEIRVNGKNFYIRIICHINEVEYKEVEGKLYPCRMKTIYGYEYSDENLNHCVTKNIITEYYVAKIEKNTILDSDEITAFKTLDFYTLTPTSDSHYYEEVVIQDDLREKVVREIFGE